MLVGALIGGIAAAIVLIISYFVKQGKYNKLLKSIPPPAPEYAALFHYASANRFRKSFKFFDSYGVLYVINKMVYYKSSTITPPMAFNLAECKVQVEPKWRWMNWFSITTPSGEKYYFDSYKMGLFSNDSTETLKALEWINSKGTVPTTSSFTPPPF